MKVSYFKSFLVGMVFYFGFLLGLQIVHEENETRISKLKAQHEEEKRIWAEAGYEKASEDFIKIFRERCDGIERIVLRNRETGKDEVYRCRLIEEIIL